MQKVFISYCHADGDFAEVVRGRIRDAGFTTWIDLEGLQAGEDWRQEIDQAIRDSVALVTILTPASRESAYVTYEWAFALGAEVKVIPLLLQPTDIHPRLSAIQYLDFTQRQTRPWPSLIEALQEAAKARPTQAIPLPRTAPILVKETVAALDNPDPQVMEQAMQRLAELDLPEAAEALVAALDHPLPDVRIAAGWQLAKRKDLRALPALIEGDRRRKWAWDFARKVAEVGPAAIPALVALLKDESPRLRRDALWGLVEIGDPAAVPEVIKMLGDAQPEVRQEALWTLQRYGTPEALAALDDAIPAFARDLQADDRGLQWSTVRVLEQVGTERALAAVAEWKRAQEAAGQDSAGTNPNTGADAKPG